MKPISAAIGLVFLASHLCSAEPKWIEVRSEHFLVVSDGSEKQAKEVALGFEKIRAVFAQGIVKLRVDSGAQTIIFAPSGEKTMKSLLPQFWERKGPKPSGLFRKGWEKDYVVVRLDQEGSDYSTIYHEYVHKLVGLNFPRLPMWLNEGLAEFYGTARFREHETLVGTPSTRIRLLLQRVPFPLKDLLAAGPGSPYFRDEDKTLMFYAESWGLTHYLTFGDKMENGGRLNDYLRLIQKGTKSEDAFHQTFGDTGDLEKGFDRYIRQFQLRAYVFHDPIQIEKPSMTARGLSPAEAASALGGFYTYFRNLDAAKEKLQLSLAQDSNLDQVHENLAFLDFLQGDDDQALKEFDLAVSLRPDNYISLYYQAMLQSKGNLEGESGVALDKQLTRVLQLNPRFAPAYVIRSRILAKQGKIAEAAVAAMNARDLEPDRAGYHLNLAEIRLLQRDPQSAITISKYLAGRWNGPDRSEALDLLSRARTSAGLQASLEEQGKEIELAEYSKELSLAVGTIDSTSCNKSSPSKITIDTNGKKTAYHIGKGFMGLGFSDTIWYGTDHFSFCHHLQGMRAVVRFRPAVADNPEELVWLEVRDDIDAPKRPD